MKLFLLTIGFGIVTSSVLSLMSVGLSLQFGVTNFVNFAYGAYLSFGMLMTWLFAAKLHFPFILAAVIGTVLTALLAVVVNELIFEPFAKRRKSIFYMLIVTFGLSLVLDNLLQIFFGVGFQKFPLKQSTALTIGPFDFTINLDYKKTHAKVPGNFRGPFPLSAGGYPVKKPLHQR